MRQLSQSANAASLVDAVIRQDIYEAVPHLPKGFVDLLILDPLYHLPKDYHGHPFIAKSKGDYTLWFTELASLLKPTLKPDATVYVCSDWKTSSLIASVLEDHFFVRNWITWEREKGRGTKANWKNNAEDIWFCTMGENHLFDVDAVKLKRKVLAPYRGADGQPKDWQTSDADNCCLTYPSNI